ncbi:hypothetical protein FB45DRAFT_907619 [Roridomyces roridus]|uniref:F-box domain-containing protein n=1 Tax=Roridomyces roridus TaxID=1738132 RepID=A0AAD7FSM1_9AGAR|nr:hypothetical protein FB45DRAFT_907619 [Roridomyces roridus]
MSTEMLLPPELIDEISARIEGKSSLCSMCLASKTTRSSALPFLFAAITLSSEEDVETWSEMLKHSPELGTRIVRKVKLSKHPTRRLLPEMTSVLFRMPSVQRIVLHAPKFDPHFWKTVTTYLPIFPNKTELYLTARFIEWGMLLDILGAFQTMKALVFLDTCSLGPSAIDAVSAFQSRVPSSRFDLSKLERLVLQRSYPDIGYALLNHSPPAALRSVVLNGLSPSPLPVFAKLMAVTVESLESISVRSKLTSEHLQIFERVESFPALRSFTMQVGKYPSTFMERFPPAPNLRLFIFRAIMREDHSALEYVDKLMGILRGGQDLHKFPRLGELKFQIRAVVSHPFEPKSDVNASQRGEFRAQVESKVREGITDWRGRLSFEWFDQELENMWSCE